MEALDRVREIETYRTSANSITKYALKYVRIYYVKITFRQNIITK